VRIVQLERVTGSPEALQPLGDMTYVRALVRLVANLDPQVLVTRRDQRPWMRLEIDAASSDLQKGFLSTRLSGQWATSVGRHHFAIRGRGVVLAGDVRFWDDIPLAGEYQRVFFNNQYWIHHAVQLETAYRVGFWRDWIAVGVFHDASLFMDRRLPVHASRPPMPSVPAYTSCCSIPSRSMCTPASASLPWASIKPSLSPCRPSSRLP